MGYGIKWINMDKPSTNCRIWPQILRRQGATYEGVQWAQSTEPNTAARHFFITMAGIIWPSTGKRNSGVMSFNVNFIHFIHFIHPTYPLYYYLCPLMNWGSQIPIRTSLMGWPSSSCFWKRSCSRTWSHMSLGEIFPSANMGQFGQFLVSDFRFFMVCLQGVLFGSPATCRLAMERETPLRVSSKHETASGKWQSVLRLTCKLDIQT